MNLTNFLAKLKETNGALSVSDSVVWFEDGTSFDLTEVGDTVGRADGDTDVLWNDVTVRISVLADSPEEAAQYALENLRKETMGPWTMEVANYLGQSTVIVGAMNEPGSVCKKCGSPMHGDYCSDGTCPYSEWPQRIPLDELATQNTAVLRERYSVVPRIRVKAEVHSDDQRVNAQFDAAPWFDQASDEDIVLLKTAGWGHDEIADEVARHFNGVHRDVDLVFDYLGALPEAIACGFECSVEEYAAMEWLKQHRPTLWLRLIGDDISMGDVAEWVGMHYKANFSAEPVDRKVDWVSRYQEAHF